MVKSHLYEGLSSPQERPHDRSYQPEGIAAESAEINILGNDQ